MLTLEPIDYIGSAPRKRRKKRRPIWNHFGAWFLLLLALGIGFYFAEPILPFLQAQQSRASETNAKQAIEELRATGQFTNRLAAAALERTGESVEFDPGYYELDYPGGDVPSGKGISTDLVVRSYRAMGIDLQQLVHEDMEQNFDLYPQLWRLKRPDYNMDHRRVPNLQRFFTRHGMALPRSQVVRDYEHGDVVTWRLPYGTQEHAASHIGIVVPGPGARKGEKWVVHNSGSGPEWEDELFGYTIVGHYRFVPQGEALTVSTKTEAGATATTAQN